MLAKQIFEASDIWRHLGIDLKIQDIDYEEIARATMKD
jgi:hypothetical protein